MIAERTIKMTVVRDGKEKEIDVRMRYCAATEAGFERLSGSSINVFSPKLGKDENGNDIIVEPAKATTQEYLYLAVAGIVSAYARREEEAPVTSEDILYDASPAAVSELLTTIIQLRAEWYAVPEVVKPDMEEEQGVDSPNA